MANVNNPHGLRSLGTNVNGGPPVIQEFTKPSSDGLAIFSGDPVARVSGGAISATLTPGTTLLSGVALDYGALSTQTLHKVIVDPGQLFEIQTAGTFAATVAGLNANLDTTAVAGSTATKQSGAQISASAPAVTSTLDLHLFGLYADAVNVAGQYSRWEVVINKHRMYGGVAGV